MNNTTAKHEKKKTTSNFGTNQWSDKTVNIQKGCENGCRYCYARGMAKRFGQLQSEAGWQQPLIDFRKVNKGYRRRCRPDGTLVTVMYPSSHDITPANLTASLMLLTKLLASGNEVLIVSKPRLDCVQELCRELEPYKAQIIFRFTIGSADDEVLKFWEPGAPSYRERVEALKWAFDKGFTTSVSCEPMLDDDIDQVIDDIRPFVTHSIWLGLMNHVSSLPQACEAKIVDDLKRRCRELQVKQNQDFIETLYDRYCEDDLIKWKKGIAEKLGIEVFRETDVGSDPLPSAEQPIPDGSKISQTLTLSGPQRP